MADNNNLSPAFSKVVPPGDDKPRDVCDSCGFVNYQNPKIITGVVAAFGDKILLCRRAIEPRKGYWTLPAGYQELKESSKDGARREAMEEAGADVEVDQLLAIYEIPEASQVMTIYRGRLKSPEIEAGPESMEVGLFAWDDIPWDQLAFPMVGEALNKYIKTKDQARVAPCHMRLFPYKSGQPPLPGVPM